MRRVVFLLWFVIYFASIVSASEACRTSELKPFKLTISYTYIGNPQTGTIYLPAMSETDDVFCGKWNIPELTEGEIKQFEAHKKKRLQVVLYPELEDGGLVLELENFESWPQKGFFV